MKKIIFGLAIISAMLLMFFGLGGCSNSHDIPNGKYVGGIAFGECFFAEESDFDFFWRIKGNNADYYSSGMRVYRCKIVMENDKIYFEGRIFKDAFSSKEMGEVFKYEVIYKEDSKSITFIR